MFSANKQAAKAEILRQQHLARKLLILPNVWDTLSARLVQAVGFPSVATASVSTALIRGYPDGEKIPFSVLLKQIREITSAVDLALTVDFERGYSSNEQELEANVQALIENGAVGLNIEDGFESGKGLVETDAHCRKIELIKETGIRLGVPLVINARTDIFLRNVYDDENLPKAIERIKAFNNAGADCAYPIFMTQYQDVQTLVAEVGMPVNVLLIKPLSDLKKLEEIGVARVSVGPGFLKSALTKMKSAAEGLQNYDSSEFFADAFIGNDFLGKLIWK